MRLGKVALCVWQVPSRLAKPLLDCPSPTLQVEDDNPFINTMPCHPILQPSEGLSDYPHPVSFDTALTVEDFEENIDLLMSETVTPSEEPFELEFPSLNNPPPGFSHDYS